MPTSGALTADNYVLSYNGGALHADRHQPPAPTWRSRAPAPSASPLTADGLSIVLSGTPAAGDQFLIQPTAQAAGSLQRGADRSRRKSPPPARCEPRPPTPIPAPPPSARGTVLNAANPNLLNTGHHSVHEPRPPTPINGARQRCLHHRRQHRRQRLAGADQRHAGHRRYLHRAEQRRRHRRQPQCAGGANLQTRGVLQNGTDQHHRRGERADHRHRAARRSRSTRRRPRKPPSTPRRRPTCSRSPASISMRRRPTSCNGSRPIRPRRRR